MKMMGYQNQVLRIDLRNQTASVEPLRMDFAEKYVGSKGLAIRYMYEELKPGIDPLGPDNKLFLTTGPLTGTPVPCSGKLSVAAKVTCHRYYERLFHRRSRRDQDKICRI